MLDKTKIGVIVELGGALAVLFGVTIEFPHLLLSIPIALGLLTIYIGRRLRAGSL